MCVQLRPENCDSVFGQRDFRTFSDAVAGQGKRKLPGRDRHLVRVLQSQLHHRRVVPPHLLDELNSHPGVVDGALNVVRIVVMHLQSDVRIVIRSAERQPGFLRVRELRCAHRLEENQKIFLVSPSNPPTHPKRHNFAANFHRLRQVVAIPFVQRNLDVSFRFAVENFHVMNELLAPNDWLEFHDVAALRCILELLNLAPIRGVRGRYLHVLHENVKVLHTPIDRTKVYELIH